MQQVYIVINQHHQYISKQKEWLDGREPKLLYRTQHHDEALNMVFELSLRDMNLRASCETCELDEKNQPIVEVIYQAPNLDEGLISEIELNEYSEDYCEK